ncbi:MAG: helix-turn-helix domain-containing protein [Atopobiaceae bacterium]|jgi:putative transcriptional regulator|nr:helix-turn-helix domain-containing protein [Atopobiaceae bacterium]
MKTLKAYRESKGIKLQAVADHLGITRQTYSSYENNQNAMSIEQAKAVCEFLGCTVTDIFLPHDVN